MCGQQQNLPLAVSPTRAAELSGLGRSTIYEALNAGELPSYKKGSRRLILVSDLLEWLKREPSDRRRGATRPPAQSAPGRESNCSGGAPTPHDDGR